MKRRYFFSAVVAATLVCGSLAAAEEPAETVQIHGFASQGFLLSDHNKYLANNTPDGSFEFNEFGISVTASPGNRLRVGMQVFSRDLGDHGNGELILDWGYGDYRLKDWLGIRAGKLKMPLGLYNETRDADVVRTNVVLPQSIYNDTNREVQMALQGAGLYGYVAAGPLGAFSYQAMIGSVNIPSGGTTETAIERGAGGLVGIDKTDPAPISVVHVEWEPRLAGLRLGYSYLPGTVVMYGRTLAAMGPLPAGLPVKATFNRYREHIGSIEYVRKDLTLAGEYYRESVDMEMAPLGIVNKTRQEAYYASAAYRFSKWLEVGTYYSVFYQNRHDKQGARFVMLGQPAHNAWQKDLTLSGRFDITDHFVFKLEGHRVNGAGLVDNDVMQTKKDWGLFAAKLSYTF